VSSFFITHIQTYCFVFGHGINLEHLGAICIPIKIKICWVIGIGLCTSLKKLFPTLRIQAFGRYCKVSQFYQNYNQGFNVVWYRV